MNKKNLIIILGSVISLFVILLLILWIVSIIKPKYFTYEEVENKIKEATSNYYKDHPEMLPSEDGKHSLSYTTLVENNYIKTLDELLEDSNSCSVEIIIVKNETNYTYVPKLTCGDKYQSVELYRQILNNNQIVTSGSGLYKNDDNSYYFKGKIDNNYISFGKIVDGKDEEPILWQIIGINSDNTLKIRAVEKLKDRIQWDNRFNVDKNNYTGYNDFEMSLFKDTLKKLENNEYFSSTEKANIVSKQLCIGQRSENQTTNDGSIECSKLTEDKYMFSTLVPYEYIRASLDENCKKLSDKSCSNFNFISSKDNGSEWVITSTPDNNYQAYIFEGSYFYLSEARRTYNMHLVTNLSEFAFYKSGLGTIDDPYIIK